MQSTSRIFSQRLQLRQILWDQSKPCAQCARCFHSSPPSKSGHSRWSKIKHDKGSNDAIKNKQRSIFAQEITTASKLFGADTISNPRLADLITRAKRAGFAKASIEAAVARGQGRSVSGASLEALTVEGILPQNVAVIIDCETDNKLRTLAEVRLQINKAGGNTTPASYLFTKKGRIVFEKKDGVEADDVLEQALEEGALDVEEDAEGRFVVFTEPNETKSTGESLASALGLDIAATEIVWDANEDTKVPLEGDNTAEALNKFIDALQEKESSVQGVYMNVAQGSIDEGAWADLQSRLST